MDLVDIHYDHLPKYSLSFPTSGGPELNAVNLHIAPSLWRSTALPEGRHRLVEGDRADLTGA